MPSIINSSTSGGLITTGSTDGQLQLQTVGTTALTVTSGQLVGVGTTSPTTILQVSATTPVVTVTGTGTTASSQDFTTNSAAQRTTIGVERSTGGGLFVGSSAYAAVFGSAGASSTQFASNNTVRMTLDTSGNLTFNTSNAGIIFNNSSALTNSTLNDYETGSFSPTWSGSTSGSGVKGSGNYTKIGNLVFVTVVVQGVTFITFSGTLQMSLPFVAYGLANAQYTGAPMYFFDGSWFNDATTAGITPYASYGSNQATFGYMYVNGLRQNSVTNSTSSLSGNSNIYARFSFMYATN